MADVPTPLRSGQRPVGGGEQVDVVVGVVGPGATRAHQYGEGFPSDSGAVINERAQRVESEPVLVGGRGVLLSAVDVDQGSVDISNGY